MKYRLWLNVPIRNVFLRSNDLDHSYDAEILMRQLLEAIPDAVAGIDTIESHTVKHSNLVKPRRDPP